MNIRRLGALKAALIVVVFFLAIPSVPQVPGPPVELQKPGQLPKQATPASISIADLPLVFELNNGQVDSKVRLLSRGPWSSVFLTPSEVAIRLSRPSPSTGDKPTDTSAARFSVPLRNRTQADLRLKFIGGRRYPQIVPEDKLPGKSHYLIGNDAAKWHTNIPHFAGGRYKGVYPGIDVLFYGNQGKLEFDFIIKEGSDPNAIKLGLEGAEKLEVDEQGDVRISLSDNEVLLRKPYCYQGTKEKGEEVEGRFVILSQNCVGFKVGAFDPSRPLVIDPTLSYSTFIGGSSGASCQSCAEDDSGNIYFAGTVGESGCFTVDPYQGSYGGGLMDGYVGKLNAAGTAVVYATYLGGSGRDETQDIDVDSHGNVYIIGSTDSANFPLKNPLQPTFGGSSVGIGDAFVAKLNSDGSALLYSTYLGGSSDEQGQGIAVDVAGNAYVMGNTGSSNFPIKGAFQGSLKGEDDAFLAKLNASGTGLLYSTYLGGSGSDVNYGYGMGDVAIDATGCAYVTGFTTSSDFPVKNAYQSNFGGGERDVFVTKFNPTGSSLIFSTYLGGSDNESYPMIAVAPNGNVGVTGGTRSTDFPTRNPFQSSVKGIRDVFVTVLSPSGSSLIFSTYLGGSGTGEIEAVNGMAFSPSNTLCVVGRTDSSDFPTSAAIQGTFQGGDTDAFVSVFSAAGSLTFSSYLGGNSNEDAYGVGFNKDGNIFVGGPTASTNFPTVNPLYGNGSIYIARIRMKITGPVPKLSSISPTSAVAGGADFTLSLTGSDFVKGCSVQWDGSARPTTYVSQTELSAAIDTANLSAGKAVKVTVANPGGGVSNAKTFNIADYGLSASPESVTVNAGQSATYQISLTPQFGSFDQAVTLSCSGLPSKCSSSFSPTSGTPGSGGASSTLTITTKAPSFSGQRFFGGSSGFPVDPLWPILAAVLLLGAYILRAPRRKWMAACLCAGRLVCLLGLLVSCESGGDGDDGPTNPGTPAGTYTVTVSGQAGTLTRSVDITLVVK